MIVVIQCAARKRSDAGRLRRADGKPVVFVAQPNLAPPDDGVAYARPDDVSEGGMSWRESLLNYNAAPHDNSLGLCPAYLLYQNKIYVRLVNRFGPENVYILSAGWGLVRADFLTPYYDITFSPSAEAYKRRYRADSYSDFRMLPDQMDQEIVFFGGKDYLPLFCSLTTAVRTKRTIFYNSAKTPRVNSCALERFATATRTNWHYECANAFLDGTR
jgi:hypothetical protein